jgi:hypothetical protein
MSAPLPIASPRVLAPDLDAANVRPVPGSPQHFSPNSSRRPIIVRRPPAAPSTVVIDGYVSPSHSRTRSPASNFATPPTTRPSPPSKLAAALTSPLSAKPALHGQRTSAISPVNGLHTHSHRHADVTATPALHSARSSSKQRHQPTTGDCTPQSTYSAQSARSLRADRLIIRANSVGRRRHSDVAPLEPSHISGTPSSLKSNTPPPASHLGSTKPQVSVFQLRIPSDTTGWLVTAVIAAVVIGCFAALSRVDSQIDQARRLDALQEQMRLAVERLNWLDSALRLRSVFDFAAGGMLVAAGLVFGVVLTRSLHDGRGAPLLTPARSPSHASQVARKSNRVESVSPPIQYELFAESGHSPSSDDSPVRPARRSREHSQTSATRARSYL